jgi:DNA invertase Pin-like site-specific DNA recombinase
MEIAMKFAAYCRVSSKNQKTDAQEAEIKKWLAGHRIPAAHVEWYRDKESGKTLVRPEFDRLQKDIFNGKVKTILVWKLDRLSRRLKDGVNLLSDWCEKRLRIVVITQQIDLSGPVGRMIAAVLLGLAEIELEYRMERQVAGIEVARKKGVYKGRVRGTTKAKPDRAIELRGQGLTTSEIANALGTSERTIWRYLTGANARLRN